MSVEGVDLYAWYLNADDAYHAHLKGCARCEGVTLCPDGQWLYKRFADLQDAYLKRRWSQRG